MTLKQYMFTYFLELLYNICMGRRTVLDEKLIDAFAEETEGGLPFNYTCDLLAISQPTATNWLKQGESDTELERETLHAQFFISYKRAYAKFIRETKKIIRKGDSGWQGAAWWLERTNTNFILNMDNANANEPVIVNPTIKPNK